LPLTTSAFGKSGHQFWTIALSSHTLLGIDAGGDPMTIQKWKDVAELIALVAVVGSLIAVVIELRQTQDALQAQTYQDRAFDAIDWHMNVAKNPQLSILNQDDFDRENLTRTEYTIAFNLLLATMIDLDNEYYQYQHGFLDQDFYYGDTVQGIVRMGPVWRKFGLRESRSEFRVEVDRILSEQADE
jgi:hypothetical protein